MSLSASAAEISRFREYLYREEKSPATIEKYCRDAALFLDWCRGAEPTKELIVSFKKMLIERGYAVRSVNSMLASVNCLLDSLGRPECKTKSVRLQRRTYCPEERELTRAEYLRLLGAAAGKPKLSLIIQTICATGIRVSELKYFTVENLRRGDIIISCKGKTRHIIVPSELKKRLLAFAERSAIAEGAVFRGRTGEPMRRTAIWAQMKSLCRAASVSETKVFPHNLRKLFARTFYAAEKDIAKLADILGHSSINTTRIYIMSTGREHRRRIERLNLLL